MAFIQFYLGRNMPPLEGRTLHHALPFWKTSTSTSHRRNDVYCNVSPQNSVSLGVKKGRFQVQETTSTLACAKILGKNGTEYVDEYGGIIEKNQQQANSGQIGHTKQPRHESDMFDRNFLPNFKEGVAKNSFTPGSPRRPGGGDDLS